MTRRAWLTPDTIPSEVICRALNIPDEPAIIAAISGALLPLTNPFNWEQFGTVTPAAIAAAMSDMYSQFFTEGCGVAQIDIAYGKHEVGQNTAGGAITLNTDTLIPFNTLQGNPDLIPALGGNIFTVVPGRYQVHMEHFVRANVNASLTCWAITSDNPAIKQGSSTLISAATRFIMACDFLWDIAAEETCEFYMRASTTQDTSFFGVPANISGHDELYGVVSFLRLGDG